MPARPMLLHTVPVAALLLITGGASGTTWDQVFIEDISRDWLGIRLYALQHAVPERYATVEQTILKVVPVSETGADAVCSLSATPAYTILGTRKIPEIHFCMKNYGFMEAYAAALSLQFYVFGATCCEQQKIKFEDFRIKYLDYLQRQWFRKKHYCEAKPYLYYLLHDLDAEKCAETAGKPEMQRKQTQWLSTAVFGGLESYNLSYERVFHRSPPKIGYDVFREGTASDYRRWSYRTVLLHELGHVLNNDFSGEGTSARESLDDDTAISIVTNRIPLRYTENILTVLEKSLAYMASVNAFATGSIANYSDERIVHLSSLISGIQKSPRPSSDVRVYSPFANALIFNGGTITYGRMLFENYQYTNNPLSVMATTQFPQSGPLYFRWDAREIKYKFENPSGVLF